MRIRSKYIYIAFHEDIHEETLTAFTSKQELVTYLTHERYVFTVMRVGDNSIEKGITYLSLEELGLT